MLLEGAIIGTTVYSMYMVINKENISKRKMKRDIKEKWIILMDAIGKNAENKIDQEYEILDIFIKHYGFDFILSIPYGKKFSDVLGLMPLIESCYKANTMINLSEDKNTAYVRVHFLDSDINTKDDLRFKWFKTFYNIDGCITKTGDTLNIDSIEEVLSPNKEVVGYRVKSKIPLGLSYEKIKGSYDTITRTLGKCFFDFDFKTMQLETTINHKGIEDNEKFIPIPVKPWEIYVSMGYDWQPIILDYSFTANTLIGGMQGTGKTVSLIMGFINLCCQCDDFQLMICNTGEKQDLKIFKDVKQCKYYASEHNEILSLLRYLIKEMDRRNKMFPAFCFNIYEYNEMAKKDSDKLQIIHFVADEIADLMCKDKNNKDDKNTEIQDLLWQLIRKGRSSGIYISVATQRGSLNNLNSEVKGQLGNKICFSQPNTASALTIASGEDVAKRVLSLEKRRECLVDYPEGIKVAKTLYLDAKMMKNLLTPMIIEEDIKLKLDANGNIIKKQEEIPEAAESNQKTVDNSKKSLKTLENTKSEPRWKQKKLKKVGKDKR